MSELAGDIIDKLQLSPEAVAAAEQRAKEHEDKERADEIMRRKKALVAMGMPVKDVELVVLLELQDTEAMLTVKRHTDTRGPIVLSGQRGCGKTTAAAWWLAQPGPRSEYLELLNPVFFSINRLQRVSRWDDKTMAPIESARRLVIDDLGSEFVDNKGSIASLLDGLINERYANMQPTLITTNLKGEDFKRTYGERIARRIREKGEFVAIKDGVQK